MTIGNQLRRRRQEKNMSLEVAADKLNISIKTIGNWESSKSYPTMMHLILLSEVYGISLDEMIKQDEVFQKSFQEKSDLKEAGRNHVFSLIGNVILVVIAMILNFTGYNNVWIFVIIAGSTLINASLLVAGILKLKDIPNDEDCNETIESKSSK